VRLVRLVTRICGHLRNAVALVWSERRNALHDPGHRKLAVPFAIVCITDRDGKALITRRYCAPAHAGAATVIRRMMSDLRRMADRAIPTPSMGLVRHLTPKAETILLGYVTIKKRSR